MRVIAGTARGIVLQAPRDRGTRPITDRVKETLFGILGERVLGLPREAQEGLQLPFREALKLQQKGAAS